MFYPHPLSGLVFEEGSYHGVESVDVPGLVHKVDSSKSGRKTVLFETEIKQLKKKQTKIIPSSWSTFSFFFGLFVSVWKAQWKGAITFLMWWTVFPLRIFYQQLINCATLVFWHTRREMRGEKEKKGNQSLWWVQWELTRIQTHRRYTIGVCCCSRSNS